MSLIGIKRSGNGLVSASRNQNVITDLEEIDPTKYQNISLLCDYQTQWVKEQSPVIVVEKSRQIGFSWTISLRLVLDAIEGKRDSIATSYNKLAIKNFTRDCARWARLFNRVFNLTVEQNIVNDRELTIFELKFINGYVITALAGDAVNLRSYSGRNIFLDEIAYREQSLDDILASAMATRIHGGKVILGSTHCGDDSEFAILVKSIRDGKLPYKLFKTTFRDAIAQGLYRRICFKNDEEWSQEKEDQWIEEIYGLYGVRAQEELDVIPSDFSQDGMIFNSKSFVRVDYVDYSSEPWNWVLMRYFDIAASDIDADDTTYYSATILMAMSLIDDKFTILEYDAAKLSPSQGDSWMINIAKGDSDNVTQIIEIEPGSSGEKYYWYIMNEMSKNGVHNVTGYKPQLSKISRLIPVANACLRKEIQIIDDIADEFTKIVKKVSAKPKPLVSDLADCISGIYDYYLNQYNAMLE